MFFISICFISFMILLIFSISLFIFSLNFLMSDLVIFIEWEIMTLNSTSVMMTFLFDWISLMFMSFVLFISSMVIYYSEDYMKEDKNIIRFILLVLMFVMSMMLLIISPNLISILLGWDGLGLVSYCLVIYFQNIKSFNAGMLTALCNRIGDVALLLAIAWMMNYGSWNYVFYLELMKTDFEVMLIGWMIVLAAMTKSAQIPFSSWLPAAMAAPTPVSALVHSSTLVTAGVYLLIRFNVLLENTNLGHFMLLISGLTMFMAGLGANFEFDLKKIIALSTLSQLGLMLSILSMGFYKLAFFHLLTHALFKALLFMCAGSIIHGMNNNQDIRMMGSLINQMPLTFSCLNLSNLALCGMPFLAGFYSSDLILEIVLLSNINIFIFFLYFFSTGLTVCYSFRLVYYSVVKNFNSSVLHLMNDEGAIMLRSMVGLLFMVIIGGSSLSWLMFPIPNMICMSIYFKLLVLFICVIGGFIGYVVSNVSLKFLNKSLNFYKISFFSGLMWNLPILSTLSMIYYPLMAGSVIYSNMDQGWSEQLGTQYMYMIFKSGAEINQVLQNNNLKIYLLSFVLWFVILLILTMY